MEIIFYLFKKSDRTNFFWVARIPSVDYSEPSVD